LNKTILKKDKLEIEQKVIEVLAVYPGISFQELVKRTGASEYEVKKCLTTYTLTSYRQIDKWRKLREPKEYHDIYWPILLHSVVIVNQGSSSGDKSYELSLFGIVLALAIISYNDQHRLKHGLHYQTIFFEDYYDKIAHNYEHKLPLIFGKWNLLKHILDLYSAYNFDIIFDKQLRRYYSQFSVIDGGNKELVESFRKIVYHNYWQISELLKQGQLVEMDFNSSQEDRYYKIGTGGQQNISKDYLMENGIDLQTPLDLDKIHSVRKKLDELRLLLNPLYQNNEITPKKLNRIEKVLVRFEGQFAKEITALYYLNLYSNYAFKIAGGHREFYTQDDSPNSRPKECLSLLIKNDASKPLLSEWFYNLIDEINSLQTEIYNALPKRPI
jgi:hypothetical protein